ncbi:MAG: N-acetyltransferase [Endomicrobium sp.]|jgi:amino-acid N-acetyltransferase|nr:N-acetyltransferase [Endomicrobium sp.]
MYEIRSAKITDAREIYKLIEYYANKKEMLHRPISAIFEEIQEFILIKENNTMVGCGALHVSWEDLAEIRSLAILENYKNNGFGSKIVNELQKNAKSLDIKKVFTLSFKPNFFKKLGYEVISKETLPHKIWNDCINCHLFPDCGEVALLKIL